MACIYCVKVGSQVFQFLERFNILCDVGGGKEVEEWVARVWVIIDTIPTEKSPPFYIKQTQRAFRVPRQMQDLQKIKQKKNGNDAKFSLCSLVDS